MTSRVEQASALGAAGVALAAFRNFAPLLWPYGVGPSCRCRRRSWFFFVDLLWVAAMLATFWRRAERNDVEALPCSTSWWQR